jgi:hypothetical protein
VKPLLIALCVCLPAFAQETRRPALHFGQDPALPPPKTLVFSVTPDKIMQDAEEWKAIGADGFFL